MASPHLLKLLYCTKINDVFRTVTYLRHDEIITVISSFPSADGASKVVQVVVQCCQ